VPLKIIIIATIATSLLKEKFNVKYMVQCKKKEQSRTVPGLVVTIKAARL
jgi:hypothetical protein